MFLPILLTSFSTYFFLLIEKVFLARLSVLDVEAAINASYVCQIFQGAGVGLAMMAQVFVGQWKGAKAWQEIGPGIWQFFWFSIIYLFITLPLGWIFGRFYFEGISIAEVVFPYYNFSLFISFLFPLGASLSSFYLGLGKTRLVLCATVISQIIKIGLCYIFIFGWDPYIPAWGLLGGAISTLIAQGGFCFVLMVGFLQEKNRALFCVNKWHFQPRFFWNCIRPGLLRAAARVLNFTSWASIAHLMAIKGGNYLVVLSIGGTITLFLSFLGDAICQTYMIVVSQIIGSRQYHMLEKVYRSGIFLTMLVILLFTFPLLVFPEYSFNLLFPTVNLSATMIRDVLFGVWLCQAFYTFSFIPLSFVLAYKDTKFVFYLGCFNWINGFLLMYVAIMKIEIAAENFWLTLVLMHASIAVLYFLRMKKLQATSLAKLTS